MISSENDKIRLVRTQDDLYGMHVDANGNLILHREDRIYNRNTTHFAVNGVVGNHAEGNFDGAIAIVADPSQMDVPSGLRQEDVWFHNDSNGNLNVGKATVLAPFGTDLPDGVNSVFYDPQSPGGRDEAVNRFLESQDVKPETIGLMGWVSNGGLSEYSEWQMRTSIELYGEKAAHIQFCSHASSIDDALDSSMNACQGMIKASKTQYISDFYKPGDAYTDAIDKKIASTYELVEKFRSVSGKEVVNKASGYLQKIEKNLEECKLENEKTKDFYSSPWRLRGNSPLSDGTALSESQIEKAISQAGISPNCEIFDIRYPENNWRPIGDLYPEILVQKKRNDMPPPLPNAVATGADSVPPPLPKPDTERRTLSELNSLAGLASISPLGSTPPPLPFYVQGGEAATKATEALGARFARLAEPVDVTLDAKRNLKI